MPTTDLTGIRAIFFDAVGTLLHPHEAVATTYRNVAMRQGVDIGEEAIAQRFREAFARQEEIDRQAGWRTSESREVERWRSIVRQTLREAPRPDELFFELWEWYRNPASWGLRPQTAEVLAQLQERGFVLGMASNFDARLVEIVAGKPELEPLADRLVISSLTGWRKPAREFYMQMIATAGQAAEQILHVGDDRRNDFDGARAVGMHAVLLSGNNEDVDPIIKELIQLI